MITMVQKPPVTMQKFHRNSRGSVKIIPPSIEQQHTNQVQLVQTNEIHRKFTALNNTLNCRFDEVKSEILGLKDVLKSKLSELSWTLIIRGIVLTILITLIVGNTASSTPSENGLSDILNSASEGSSL